MENSEKLNGKLKVLQTKMLDHALETQREEFSNTNKLETFESYSNRIKEQYFAASEPYLYHILDGYEAIIEEIATQIK